MKALTIRQPWAQLIALGVKTIETRSWSTRYRGPLAIHAGVRSATFNDAWPAWEAVGLDADSMVATRYPSRDRGADPLPLGAVVTVADLVDVVPMVAWAPLDGPATWAARLTLPSGTVEGILLRDHRTGAEAIRVHGPLPADIDVTDQLPYGDFTPGRYAWLLNNVRPIDPVPAKGRQGLWTPDPQLRLDLGHATHRAALR